jgi:hypothetical protein
VEHCRPAAAGLLEGLGEGDGDNVRLPAAALYVKAGADPEVIPVWIAEGKRRPPGPDELEPLRPFGVTARGRP